MRHAAALIAALTTAACGSVAGNDDDTTDTTDETDDQHDTQHETETGGDADADVDAATEATEAEDQAEAEAEADVDAGDDTTGTIDCSVDKLCERCSGTWEIAIEPAPGFPLTIDGDGDGSRIVVSGGCEYTAGPGAWFHDCDPTGPVVVLVETLAAWTTYRVHVDATCEEG
ncbi:MAG: hypothetical protein ABFD77_00105 [Thermotogota bacterium]